MDKGHLKGSKMKTVETFMARKVGIGGGVLNMGKQSSHKLLYFY